MDYRDTILEYIRGAKIFTVAEIQHALSLGYRAVRDFISELERECDVVFVGGMQYRWSGDDEDHFSSDEDEHSSEKTAKAEKKADRPDPNWRKRDEDEDEKDLDDFLSLRKRFFDSFTKTEPTDFSSERARQNGIYKTPKKSKEDQTPGQKRRIFLSDEEVQVIIEDSLENRYIYDCDTKTIRQRMMPTFPDGSPVELKYEHKGTVHRLTDCGGLYKYLLSVTPHLGFMEPEKWIKKTLRRLAKDTPLAIIGENVTNTLIVIGDENDVAENVGYINSFFETVCSYIERGCSNIPDDNINRVCAVMQREYFIDRLKDEETGLDLSDISGEVYRLVKLVAAMHPCHSIDDAIDIAAGARLWAEGNNSTAAIVYCALYNKLAELSPIEFNILQKMSP